MGPDMPHGVWQGKAAYMVSDNRIYVAGGEVADPANYLQILNLATMVWSAGTPLPVGVGQGNLVSFNTQLLYFGGYNQTSHATNETLSYSGGTWTKVKPMPAPLTYAAAVRAIDDQIYVIGGSDQYMLAQNSLAGVYAYEPRSKTWTTVASLPVPRENPVAGITSYGTIVCAGGSNLSQSMNTVLSLRIASMAVTTVLSSTVKTGGPISVTFTASMTYRPLAFVEGEVYLKDVMGVSFDLGSASASSGQQMTTFDVPQYAALGSARLNVPGLTAHDARGYTWTLPSLTSAAFTIAPGQPTQDQIDILATRVIELQAQLLEQNASLAVMSANSTSQASQVYVLQGSIEAAQENVDLLNAQLLTAQAQLASLQAQTNSSIGSASDWQNQSQSQLTALQAQIDLLNSQVNASQQQLGQIRTDAGSVQASADRKMDSTTGMLAVVLMIAAIAGLALAMVLVMRRK